MKEKTPLLPDLGGECRHRLRVDEKTMCFPVPRGGFRLLGANERNLGLPDPGGGCRLLGVYERNLGQPDPGGGCSQRSCCHSQECLKTVLGADLII